MLDDHRSSTAVIVAAAGAGLRLGAGEPKALRLLAGAPLLVHAIRGVAAAGCAGHLVVVAPAGEEPAMRALAAPFQRPDLDCTVVAGGSERQASVAAGLAALPAEVAVVLVHDAARALTPASLLTRVAEAVWQGQDAVVPVLPVTDTIVRVDTSGAVTDRPDRDALRAVQTPQGFRREVLVTAHRAAPGAGATDDAGLVARQGLSVHTVQGSPCAMKITTAYDLAVAEALLAAAA